MRKTKTFLLLLSCTGMIKAGAQTVHEHDDCSRVQTKEELLLYKQSQTNDSIALLKMTGAKKVSTMFDAVPLGLISSMEINAEADHVNGFFNGIPNADQYLVLISEQENLSAQPVNGISYEAGQILGNAKVVSYGQAMAFSATGLMPGAAYWLHIFAINSNSVSGALYNTNEAYKAQVVAKAAAGMNYYFGTLHSHSSYSDGNKDNTALTPADDYAYAKNSMCMDFLGISEHNHFSSTNNPGMHVADYQPGITAANQFTSNNPGFLALYGMEWGVINNGGHVIIYGVDSLIGWETLSGNPNYNIYVDKYDYTGPHGLFKTVSRFAYNKAFASFAHPDNSDYSDLRHIAYDSVADNAVIGCALESGPAFSTDDTYTDDPTPNGYLSYYNGMLSRGYHLGPFLDHDTHNLTFGRNTKARHVVIAPSIGKSDFFDAMRDMHFYATEMCDTKVDFSLAGQMMGSVITHSGIPSLVVTASNATAPGTPTITIYSGTPGSGVNPVAVSSGTGTLNYSDNGLADGSTAYYYANIKINGKSTITSPIWYTRNDAVSIVNTLANELKNDLRVNGNPVQNNMLHLNITSATHEHVEITIHDIAGRLLLSQNIADGNSSKEIDLSAFAAGSYIVTAHFSNEQISRLIVK